MDSANSEYLLCRGVGAEMPSPFKFKAGTGGNSRPSRQSQSQSRPSCPALHPAEDERLKNCQKPPEGRRKKIGNPVPPVPPFVTDPIPVPPFLSRPSRKGRGNYGEITLSINERTLILLFSSNWKITVAVSLSNSQAGSPDWDILC